MRIALKIPPRPKNPYDTPNLTRVKSWGGNRVPIIPPRPKNRHEIKGDRVIAWFSCGAASAVAAMLAVKKYGSIVNIVYCDTSSSEHPDNPRFLVEVERWIGKPIKRIRSMKFSNIDEVFVRTQYLNGMFGAPCTIELKKKPRFSYQRADDIHIFGLTADEQKRIEQFSSNNHELRLEWILADRGITKDLCFQIIKSAGIELPVMYRLGFKYNNCIGCVKSASPQYWNMVRKHFPDTFKRRAEQSRLFKTKLVLLNGKWIYLDKLPEEATEAIEEDLSCGPMCGGKF